MNETQQYLQDAATLAYKNVPQEQKEMVNAVAKKVSIIHCLLLSSRHWYCLSVCMCKHQVETSTANAVAAASEFSDDISEQITAEVERRILEKLHQVFTVVGDTIKEGSVDPDAPEVRQPKIKTKLV